jgi:hypothetical protein
MKYLHLISGPRNISTALMYSFAQRTDTQVVDEPFYAYYLSRTNVRHPGEEEVMRSQSSNEEEVKRTLFTHHSKPVLFIKNMAHHIEVLNDNSFLEHCLSIFLIRNPKQILASYAQVIEKPVLRDIGIAYEYELFEKLKNSNPMVIDSGLLLQNPESVLKKVCDRAGIEFEKNMLSWPAGPKPYDGVWAPYWYSNVHQSTGFDKQPTSERPLPESLLPVYEEAKPFYETLLSHALTP